MSDNVSQLYSQQPKKMVVRIATFVLIVLFVLAVVAAFLFADDLNFDAVRRYVKYLSVTEAENSARFSFDAHSGNRYAGVQDGLAVASVSGLVLMDADGDVSVSMDAEMKSVSLMEENGTVLAYDVGGQQLLVSGEKAEFALDAGRGILDADLSSDGCVCYSVPETGYKSVVYVLNRDGTMRYRWLSSSRYMPLCTVSTDGKYLATVSLGQQNGIFQSTMHVFKTDAEQPLASVTLGSELLYDLEFLPDGTLYAIGQDSTIHMQMDGTLLGRFRYGDAQLRDFDGSGDGFITLSLNRNRTGERYAVATLAPDGSVLGEVGLSEEALDISACGKYVAVLTAGSLHIYNDTMTLYAEKENAAGASDVIMRADGSAILISGGEGSLFIP
ncbi:MAG: hypothetical protein IIY04_03075 [Oscillospiraceae bacterium]|nr:hypothetical protein [Oscillospiraceae bacterium]